MFNGEHRDKVNVDCVDYVMVSGDNNSIQSFDGPYVISYYSSLVDMNIEDLKIVFTNSRVLMPGPH